MGLLWNFHRNHLNKKQSSNGRISSSLKNGIKDSYTSL